MSTECCSDPIIHMMGGYVSSFFIASWPTSVVKGLLPPGVELAEQSITPAGEHPVFFGFGKQEDVQLTYFKWLPFFPLNYLEFFIGIPAVRRKSFGICPYDEPYMYLARLYLNRFIPVFGGVLFWGFPKMLASIQRTPTHYQVDTLQGHNPIVSLQSTPTGPFIPAPNNQNFAFTGGLLGQRLLQKSLEGHGPLVSAAMTWMLADAELRPIDATMTISQAFLPGLPTGTFTQHGIDLNPIGAFELRTKWRLSLPFPPGSPALPGAPGTSA